MNRTKTNFGVDLLAFAAFLFLTTTGVLLRYLLPAGSGGRQGGGLHVWGLDRHEWGAIHFWIAVVLLAILAVHLLLHWRWILAVLRGRPRESQGARSLIGALAVVALIGLAVAPLLAPTQGQPGKTQAAQSASYSHDESEETINGSMTLAEVEAATGVPSAILIAELGLPSGTDPDSRLGPLRRQHGFDMDAVREIVARHR